MRAKLVEIKEALNRMRRVPVPEQGRWLGQVMRGYLAYSAVPTNSRKITSFHYLRGVALATRALTPQPEGQRLVDADGADRRAVDATRQHQPSLAAASLPRQTPEVGAECARSARSDLFGGRR